jgi:peptidoglycan-associated lipoprotein
MTHRKTCLAVLLVVSLVGFAAGCKKTPPQTEPTPPPESREPAPPVEPPPVEVKDDDFAATPPPPEPEVITVTELSRQLRSVYFAFDKYDLTDESRRILQGNATILQNNAGFRVVIEGHCDERGTIEYNLALGEKRARAVRDYMASLGLGAGRMRIVTYGEERPAVPGHGEAAWAKNRRAEFKAEQ